MAAFTYAHSSEQMPDTLAAESLEIVQLLLRDYHPRDFSVRMWDGAEWASETDRPQFTLILRRPDALRRMLQREASGLALCEAFIDGKIDVEGDLEAAVPISDYLLNLNLPMATKLRLGWRVSSLPKDGASNGDGSRGAVLRGRAHSKERDRQAISHHYDVSNDFYALWLDRQMVYSCAYFEHGDEDLDRAQTRKLDYICRKLQLRRGDRLLDVGCGWGGLIRHAARHYGVDALGITISEEQARLARERIEQAGLSERCRVEVCDYRDLEGGGSFDKMVSVGMFEHVGEKLLPCYFQAAWQLLRPGGIFLNHGIARREIDPPSDRQAFIIRYVFPDGELVPINVALRVAEEAGFEVRDVESLREHYALTLRHWDRHLQNHLDEARRIVGERTCRTWQLFLCGSAQAFNAGTLNIYQSLLVKPDQGRSGFPLTRAGWYNPAAVATE